MAEGTVQVLDRAFDLLEALARGHGPLGLSEIAQRTGMSKSTVFRILQTMVARGYVRRRSKAPTPSVPRCSTR